MMSASSLFAWGGAVTEIVEDAAGDGGAALPSLLFEDELLQELKSGSDALLSYLTDPPVLAALVGYITGETVAAAPACDAAAPAAAAAAAADAAADAAAAAAAAARAAARLATLATEVVCADVERIIEAFANPDTGHCGAIERMLASSPAPLCPRKAGDCQKIVAALLRMRPLAAAAWLQRGGEGLLELFLRHLGSYGVARCLEQLFVLERCAPLLRPAWLDSPNTAAALVAVVASDPARAEAGAGILAHVAAQSPASSALLAGLCDRPNLVALFDLAVPAGAIGGDESGTHDAAPAASSAVVALEAVMRRAAADPEVLALLSSPTAAAAAPPLSAAVAPYARRLVGVLQRFADRTRVVAGGHEFQNGQRHARLGPQRLKCLELLEALFQLRDPAMDAVLLEAKALDAAAALLLALPQHSLVHKAVLSIALGVAEASPRRDALVAHLLAGCGLPARLMAADWGGAAGPLLTLAWGLQHALLKSPAGQGLELWSAADADAWRAFMRGPAALHLSNQVKPVGGFYFPSRNEMFGAEESDGEDELEFATRGDDDEEEDTGYGFGGRE